MTNSVERFTDRVGNYAKYRPGYPPKIVEYLTNAIGLTPDWLIADIGSGTGLSSRIFLDNGNRVIGVEPNSAMREAAAALFEGVENYQIVDGTSTATTLDTASVDLVVAAQAFHWFDPERTRDEFRRILKPGGYVALVWNERQLDTTDFLIGYEALLVKFQKDYGAVRHENIHCQELLDFFQKEFETATFPNLQVFDLEGIRGRMLSSSYMPNESDESFPEMIAELEALFAKHAESGKIKVFYDTNVYISRL